MSLALATKGITGITMKTFNVYVDKPIVTVSKVYKLSTINIKLIRPIMRAEVK